MAKDPFEQFMIPNEMRAFAERSVTQAREAFEGFVEAASKAVGQMQDSAQAAHSGATEIAQKSISYAEQNVEATFDFAQKLMKAFDLDEIQTEAIIDAQLYRIAQMEIKKILDELREKKKLAASKTKQAFAPVNCTSVPAIAGAMI